MSNIKTVIVRYLRLSALIMVLLVILLAMFVQVFYEQKVTRTAAAGMFLQVKQLLEVNSRELEELKAKYSESCLKNAETVAYIIQSDPTVLESREALLKIAEFTEVDEIHLFNEDGVIFNGTHPEYYGLSVNAGDQIGFFKPMLSNKSLKLVQELTPNTADANLIQYSAVWSADGEYFVQVGMKQETVQNITKKNDMSYIFSMLGSNSEIQLFAVEKTSYKIIAASSPALVGNTLESIGIPVSKIVTKKDGFHAVVNGTLSFCIFEEFGDTYLCRVVTAGEMYRNVGSILIALAIGAIAFGVLLVVTVTRFLNKEIIHGVKNINAKLTEITNGNLDARVSERSTVEFSELSDHINNMIATVLASTDKISYILDRANLRIGVYEINENMKTVRVTDKAFSILQASYREQQMLSEDYTLFKEYLNARIYDCVDEAEKTYRLYGAEERYIRCEEFFLHNSVLGILMDVTEEYMRRRQLEDERDIDGLTGLLNRAGLDRRLESLFAHPDKLGFGALVMIDADGLKNINDTLGHEAGDAYLKSIADSLRTFDARKAVVSRQGGDEYVLFLHGFDSAQELGHELHRLEEIQCTVTAKVTPSKTVPIRFSFGVTMLDGSSDYAALMKSADDKMYASKRERKQRLGIPGRK